MAAAATLTREAPAGGQLKQLRVSMGLTQAGLAVLAGVTRREVDLHERGLPVALDCRRRIRRQLWAIKTGK